MAVTPSRFAYLTWARLEIEADNLFFSFFHIKSGVK